MANSSLAQLLESIEQLPLNSEARRRLETQVLEQTEVVNMNQLATFVEVLAYHAAVENGAHGDQDTAEALYGNAQTIAQALRKLHELIQELA